MGNCDYIIEDRQLIKYIGKGGSVVIPEGITSISQQAFENCVDIIKVVLPNSLISIGDWAFAGCMNLAAIVIPEGVISIGSRAFDSCKNLTSIIIPASVTNIGYGAFMKCTSIASIAVSEHNKLFSAVNNCLFDKLTNKLIFGSSDSKIFAGITCIDSFAFDSCESLKEIVIPDGVIKIGKKAFYDCKI